MNACLRTHFGVICKDFLYKLLSYRQEFADEGGPIPFRTVTPYSSKAGCAQLFQFFDIDPGRGYTQVVFQLFHAVFVNMEVRQRRRRSSNVHWLKGGWFSRLIAFRGWDFLLLLVSCFVWLRIREISGKECGNLLLRLLSGDDEWVWAFKPLVGRKCRGG